MHTNFQVRVTSNISKLSNTIWRKQKASNTFSKNTRNSQPKRTGHFKMHLYKTAKVEKGSHHWKSTQKKHTCLHQIPQLNKKNALQCANSSVKFSNLVANASTCFNNSAWKLACRKDGMSVKVGSFFPETPQPAGSWKSLNWKRKIIWTKPPFFGFQKVVISRLQSRQMKVWFSPFDFFPGNPDPRWRLRGVVIPVIL